MIGKMLLLDGWVGLAWKHICGLTAEVPAFFGYTGGISRFHII